MMRVSFLILVLSDGLLISAVCAVGNEVLGVVEQELKNTSIKQAKMGRAFMAFGCNIRLLGLGCLDPVSWNRKEAGV